MNLATATATMTATATATMTATATATMTANRDHDRDHYKAHHKAHYKAHYTAHYKAHYTAHYKGAAHRVTLVHFCFLFFFVSFSHLEEHFVGHPVPDAAEHGLVQEHCLHHALAALQGGRQRPRGWEVRERASRQLREGGGCQRLWEHQRVGVT